LLTIYREATLYFVGFSFVYNYLTEVSNAIRLMRCSEFF